MHSVRETNSDAGIQTFFKKAQNGSVRIASKSKQFYKSLKKNIQNKVKYGPEDQDATFHSSPQKSSFYSTSLSSPKNSSFVSSQIHPASLKHNDPCPKSESISSPKNVQHIEEVSKLQLVQYTNELLYEIAMGISPNFFQDPTESAILTTDKQENTEWVGFGEISMSPYDTAWVAMIPVPKYKETLDPQDFQLAFPECFIWLLFSQKLHGRLPHVGPGCISPFFAILLALGMFRKRSGPYFEQKLREMNITPYHFERFFEKTRAQLRKALNEWDIDEIDFSGFEIIIPYHMNELEKLDPPVIFDFPDKQRLLKENQRKMSILPVDAIFAMAANRKPVSIIYSLEALSGIIDLSRCQNPGFQALNGSYGGSPAATAAILISAPKWDHKAYEFLKKAIEKRPQYAGGCGYVPTVYDVGTFEICWVMHCLGEIVLKSSQQNTLNIPSTLLEKTRANYGSYITYLKTILEHQKGTLRWTSYDNRIPADVDDTAVAYFLITQFCPNYKFDLEKLMKSFWNGTYFITFPKERTFSVSCNSHVLSLLISQYEIVKKQQLNGDLETTTQLPAESSAIDLHHVIVATTNFIKSQRKENFTWSDKWHSSPWYTTMKSISTLLNLQHYPELLSATSFKTKEALFEFCGESIGRALSLQYPDGSWGQRYIDNSSGNMEETSYIVRLLQAAKKTWIKDNAILEAITKGRQFLLVQFEDAVTDPNFFHNQEPHLWIAKQLFTAPRIIRSSILLALWDESNE